MICLLFLCNTAPKLVDRLGSSSQELGVIERARLQYGDTVGLDPLMPSPRRHACPRLSNQGRRHAAWSHAKIQYLCLQFDTPQTQTKGSGHPSIRLAYLTLGFHGIRAPSLRQSIATKTLWDYLCQTLASIRLHD